MFLKLKTIFLKKNKVEEKSERCCSENISPLLLVFLITLSASFLQIAEFFTLNKGDK